MRRNLSEQRRTDSESGSTSNLTMERAALSENFLRDQDVSEEVFQKQGHSMFMALYLSKVTIPSSFLAEFARRHGSHSEFGNAEWTYQLSTILSPILNIPAYSSDVKCALSKTCDILALYCSHGSCNVCHKTLTPGAIVARSKPLCHLCGPWYCNGCVREKEWQCGRPHWGLCVGCRRKTCRSHTGTCLVLENCRKCEDRVVCKKCQQTKVGVIWWKKAFPETAKCVGDEDECDTIVCLKHEQEDRSRPLCREHQPRLF